MTPDEFDEIRKAQGRGILLMIGGGAILALASAVFGHDAVANVWFGIGGVILILVWGIIECCVDATYRFKMWHRFRKVRR